MNKNCTLNLTLGIGLLFLCGSTFAQDSIPAILSDEATQNDVYLPDFSYAGYKNGLKAIPKAAGKTFDVVKFGAKPDDGLDDSAAILEALQAAHSHKGPSILAFPQGRFIITEILRINRSDIILRGTGRGSDGTLLYFPRPLELVGDGGKLDELRRYLVKYDKRQREPKNNLDVQFSEYSWTGGFIWIGKKNSRPAPYLEEFDKRAAKIADGKLGNRGEKTLRLSSVGDVTPGQWVEILWYNQQGAEAPLLDALYGETDLKIGSHHWTFKNRPLVRQRMQIAKIEGDVVSFAAPLLHDINDEIPAEIALWDPLTNVGVEDIKIVFPGAANFGHHTEQGYNGIYMTGAADSWIRNITVENADSGMLTYDSTNLTIKNIRSEGTRRSHYAVHMGNVHNVLAENVQIFNPVRHSLTFNTQSTRSVYKNSEVFVTPTLDQHAGANHQNLFDNVTVHIQAKKDKENKKPFYQIFDGSGAGYWQPGHGGFNTTWNLKVIVESGASPDETVVLQGLDEGPMARIIGVSGNRPFEVDYRPTPYIDRLNSEITAVPSLYDYQLHQRLLSRDD